MRSLTIPIEASGALVQVEVGVSAPRRTALLRAGLLPPPSVQVMMLVDTGASHTFVGTQELKSLDLSPRDSYSFHTASTQDEPDRCDEYDVSLMLGTHAEQNLWRIDPFRIMATDFIHRRRHGLLGRDVLDRVQLEWNGPARTLVMLYP